MNATPVYVIFVASIFTNNILLSSLLGMCSYIVCSNRIETATGLGAAVTFVTGFTTMLNYLVYYYILVPLKLEFLSFIIFIAVIAAFVQFVEMFVERFSPKLYYSLGIFLPLITVNCAIMGAALLISRDGGQSWSDWRAGAPVAEGVVSVAAPQGLAPGAPLLAGLVTGQILRL